MRRRRRKKEEELLPSPSSIHFHFFFLGGNRRQNRSDRASATQVTQGARPMQHDCQDTGFGSLAGVPRSDLPTLGKHTGSLTQRPGRPQQPLALPLAGPCDTYLALDVKDVHGGRRHPVTLAAWVSAENGVSLNGKVHFPLVHVPPVNTKQKNCGFCVTDLGPYPTAEAAAGWPGSGP
jgi:hypothetical protein